MMPKYRMCEHCRMRKRLAVILGQVLWVHDPGRGKRCLEIRARREARLEREKEEK